MDTYHHVLSVIKKLGYICDTSLYLTDYQYGLFSRRWSKLEVIIKQSPLRSTGQNSSSVIMIVCSHSGCALFFYHLSSNNEPMFAARTEAVLTSFSLNCLSRWILLLWPFVRVSPNLLDSVGQMVFRFLYDQFFQSAFFALWIALRGLLPKTETMILNFITVQQHQSF